MNIKYKLEFSDCPDYVTEYMPFVRYLLYHSQQNIAPSTLRYEPNLENIIQGQILAQRLGLLLFKEKKSGWGPQQVELKNMGQEPRWVLSQQFQTQYLQPYVKDQLIFKIPAHTNLKLQIQFEKGIGSAHARFSKIEGYRYSPSTKTVEFELTDGFADEILKNLSEFIELELNEDL